MPPPGPQPHPMGSPPPTLSPEAAWDRLGGYATLLASRRRARVSQVCHSQTLVLTDSPATCAACARGPSFAANRGCYAPFGLCWASVGRLRARRGARELGSAARAIAPTRKQRAVV
jgi:hypothetical protein